MIHSGLENIYVFCFYAEKSSKTKAEPLDRNKGVE